ncbi:conjugative transposon protein TraN [Elizabethkingia anophelis]|uniref:conjugative transposon protein TraN n=1 Tax=Elizabethkingia anophelis TaxID=1117645 RepID=UPI00099A7B33|nr:conjugative transposon protein TraN [Elizabethkingia anophelis]AQX90546.1 hypothetical protein AYC67_16650 [Elizabethkingia anophelis]EHM7980961.1 conjugative transposon protein TraN [Elizabethkingia anophelis]EHM8032180.1 conjugative transposon protein TraN [Elizabethkingia anophelis]EHM8033927.1 conjugative transposon protein TraN [Elizabethkingia anophelis]EHZ9535134.1 conjugative transposon protein TraN [Elizabethkingia anophelis]
MKTFIKPIIIVFLIVLSGGWGYAQQAENRGAATDSLDFKEKQEVSLLDKAKIIPYWLSVTYDKTSHMIFPSKIRYVDLGSEYLIASKAEGLDNVLRIKASVRNFESETNFSVITEDGKFYNFDVFYSAVPAAVNYDLSKIWEHNSGKKGSEVNFEELGGYSSSLSESVLSLIDDRENKMHNGYITSGRDGIKISLKGIYIHQGKFYFSSAFKNKSNIPFYIDSIIFRIVDKKISKDIVLQEQILSPLRVYKILDKINGKAELKNIFMLDQFTLSNDKVLQIEIFEKNGERHPVLKVKSSDLLKAKMIDENIQLSD